MIWRKFTLGLAKYTAVLLCLLTILLTTPWGTQISIALLNNIDGIDIDYRDGALVRDIELNSFNLQLESLDITIIGLSTELDFSCAWKKRLCVKSLIADDFSLLYSSDDEKTVHDNEKGKDKEKPQDNTLFKMPFSIEADDVYLKNSYLNINNTEISIEEFKSQLSIVKSTFNFLKSSATQLTVIVDDNEQLKKTVQSSASLTPTTLTPRPLTNSVTPEFVNKNTIKVNTFAELPTINLPISLNIQQLSVTNIVVKTSKNSEFTQQWHSSDNKLGGIWEHTDVNISHFQTSTSSFAITQLVGKATLQSPYQLDTQFSSHLKAISHWPEINNTTQDVSLKGSFTDLTIEISSQGDLAFTSYADVNLVHNDMPFNVSLDAQKIPLPLALSQYGHPSSLSFSLIGDLNKQTLDLKSQLNGYGYTNADIALVAEHQQGHINLTQLQFSDNKTTSQLKANGAISLKPDDFNWDISAQSTGFTLPEINLHELITLVSSDTDVESFPLILPKLINGRVEGIIASKGKWSTNQWSVSLNNTHIFGEINNEDLNIEADIGLNHSGKLAQGDLLVEFDSNKLMIHTSNDSFWGINGELSINKVSQWFKEVNGNFSSTFSVSGEQNNPLININSQLSQLNWKHWSSDLLTLGVSYQPLNGHQIILSVANDHLTMMNNDSLFNLDDFVLSIEGNAKKHQITSHWSGDTSGQLSISGHLDESFNQWQSLIEQSSLTYQDVTLKNDKSFAVGIDLSKQSSVIGNHCWLSKGVSICLPNETSIGDSGDVAIILALDLDSIDELIIPKDIELNSQLRGQVSAKWSENESVIANANFSLSPGYVRIKDDLNAYQLSQWSQGKFVLSVDEQELTSELSLIDHQDFPLININTHLRFLEDKPIEDAPIKTQVRLNQFNLQPFQSILTDVISLQGLLTADIEVEGTIKSPIINGDLALDNGKLRLSQNANTLSSITSTLAIENNKAILNGSFFLEDKKADLTGTASWKDNLSLDVDLTGDALPLVFPPQLVMSVSPNINFSLKGKSLFINGSVDVVDGNYNIEQLPEGSISLSNDVIVVDQSGQAIVKETTGFDIKTNVKVNIAKTFNVLGQGLKSHLFGELQITQKDKNPLQLFGQIQSFDGTFKAYGQRLNIEKGEFTFNGPIDNPYLNIRAARNIKAEDIDVGMQVTGLADALEMELFSTPTMEMPEILSYLVRGRSLDAGTGNSSAAASLLVGFGVTNSVGLFKQIEKIPLVNNLTVDTEGAGDDTQATVSGYIGNRIYLKYGIGVYEPINELTVRLFMLNRFWLEIVSGIEQSSDLYYSFDID